jgi:hypothetical protein
MNIIQCNKIIVTALIFTMFVALANQPLPAKDRRGATVEVTMSDGSKVKGELLAVKADVLLVYDSAARQGKNIDLRQVTKVRVLKKSKFGEGLLIGLGVAVGMSVIIQSKKNEFGFVFTFIGIGSQTALFGGIIGAVAGIDKKISLAGVSSQDILFNIEQLKRYAREQCAEKPAAD